MSAKIFEFLSSGTTCVAYGSLIISILGLLLSYSNSRKERFNIEIKHRYEHLFKPISTALGNRYSLTLILKITNHSSAPIQISDVQLVLPNGYIESCAKQGIDLIISERHGDGISYTSLKNLISFPCYLKQYEEIEGRVLFVHAGGGYNKDFNSIEARIVTSRGKRKIRLIVPSRKYLNSFFNQVQPQGKPSKKQ